MPHKTVDVVISGGAMTGSVLALALSHFCQHKIRIALVEKSLPNPAQTGGFDARSIALAWGSLLKFRQISPLVEAKIRELGTPISQILVSDRGHFGKTTLSAAELNLPQLGTVVEIAKLGNWLNEQIRQQPNIQLFCPDAIVAVNRSEMACEVKLASNEVLTCSLLVAADGIQSHLAQLCGVQTEIVKDYQQTAIIANLEVSEDHQGQAFERFLGDGVLALLPLSEKRMSLVWCLSNRAEKPNGAEKLALSDEAILAELQQLFGWQLGKFKQISPRFAYPLQLQKSQSHIHHRLAIVGNSAQMLHPVAGQGFNLGLRDLFELAEKVSEAFKQGKDIGDYRLLNAFEQARNLDQQAMMQRTDGLISLFVNDCLPLQAVRNLGLFAFSHNKLARQQFAHRALGF